MYWALVAYFMLSLGSMATMSIGILLVATVTGYAILRGQKLSLSSEEKVTLLAGVALASACVLSLLAAAFDPPVYGGRTSEVRWAAELPKFWYLLAPPFLGAVLRTLSPDQRSGLLRGWILAMSVFSIICVIQFFTGWPRPQPIPGFSPYFHMTGFLGHHLSLASIWIFPVFVAMSLWRESPRARWGLGLAALLGTIALYGSFSRTLWVAFLLGLGVWVVIEKGGRVAGRRAVGIVSVVLVVLLVGSSVPSIRARYLGGMGVSERTQLWEANLSFFRDRPVVGVGFKHNQELAAYYLQSKLGVEDVFTGHAHNNLIDMMGGTGALGALLWLIWCGWFTWLIWRRVREGSSLAAGILGAWVVFQVNGLTQVNFWEGKVEHQLMIALALILSEPRRGALESQGGPRT